MRFAKNVQKTLSDTLRLSLYPQQQEENDVHMTILFKGGHSHSFTWRNIDDVDPMEAFVSHIEKYGFAGWRMVGGLVINMADVSSMWVSSPPNETRKAD